MDLLEGGREGGEREGGGGGSFSQAVYTDNYHEVGPYHVIYVYIYI